MVRPVNARSRLPRTFLVAGLLALVGCDDLGEFRGKFRGDIVEGGFVRSCFGSEVKATLVFDPDLAVAPLPEGLSPAQQNRLTTSDGIFEDTPLVPLSALPHDQLSRLDFPGSRRLRSFLLFARPERGPLAGRDATVVISLMADERVELRIMARGGDGTDACQDEAPDDAGAPPSRPGIHEYYGLFLLESP